MQSAQLSGLAGWVADVVATLGWVGAPAPDGQQQRQRAVPPTGWVSRRRL